MDAIPREVQEALLAARRKQARKTARLRVAVGDEMIPVLEFRDGGFALDIADAPKLRGLVDIYAGPNHMCQCLIVACEAEGALMRYEFKRSTPVSTTPPVDFARDPDAPVGLLPR